ncbi:MAG: EAL domain-containing protein [Planctomycetes bacterium]|nr:EAL domain-containing protein [Planctomycetota bacterium]
MREAVDPRRSILYATPLAAFSLDADQNVTAWNAAAERLFGWKELEVLGRPCPIVPEGRRTEEDGWRQDVMGGAEFANAETTRLRRDGSEVAVAVSMAPIRTDGGAVSGILILFSDISERRRSDESRASASTAQQRELEDRVVQASRVDPLTGLANRPMFLQKAGESVESAAVRGSTPALLLLDLDRFKTVNDTLGHESGDRILVEVAERLRAIVRAEDTLARLGQDQYAILMVRSDEAEAVMLAREALEQLARPLHVSGHTIHLTASLGVALYPRDGETAEALLKNADRAMHRAKEEGIGLRFFDAAQDTQGPERLWIETDLRRALDRGKLTLVTQPIRRLADDRIVGAEALIRWVHPEKGPISPGRFIPIAEETGLIIPLDRWVVTSAVRQLSKWAKSRPGAWLTANISPRTLHDPDFPARVKALMAEFHADPSRLVLEITERVLADPGRTLEIIRRLREMGVRIAVDDFGTGYSSLVYLQEFPLDFLKVDQQFVRSIGAHEKGQAIARTVIALSHNLGVEALAEGIEEPAQLEWLRNEGCDFGQGYHLGMPVPAEELHWTAE